MKLQTLVNFLRQELLIINSFFWLFSQFIFCCNISVLRRNEQDGVGLEDIDALQLELEALLSATVVRKLTLKEEVKILANIEKYRGQGKSFKRVTKVSAFEALQQLVFQDEMEAVMALAEKPVIGGYFGRRALPYLWMQ